MMGDALAVIGVLAAVLALRHLLKAMGVPT